MLDVLHSNLATSYFSAAVAAGDVSFNALSTTEANKFPIPTGGRFFRLVLQRKATLEYEVVYCTSRNGVTFTVTRGQEGTTPLTFILGDIFSCRATAAEFDGLKHAYSTFTPAIIGTTGTQKTVTAVAIAGTTATATSTAHGYSNGDMVFHPAGWPNANLEGAFVIANVTANTYDFTFRTDLSNTVPVAASGLTCLSQKSGVQSVVGRYRIEDGAVDCMFTIVTSSLANITGNVQLLVPVLPGAYAGESGVANLGYYQGITHTGGLVGRMRQAAQYNAIDVTQNVGSGLTLGLLAAGGLAAATTIVCSVRYFR